MRPRTQIVCSHVPVFKEDGPQRLGLGSQLWNLPPPAEMQRARHGVRLHLRAPHNPLSGSATCDVGKQVCEG